MFLSRYSYLYVKHADKGAHYEVHHEEAALVQRIFQLYVAGGLSQDAIAAQLTREGVPTPGERRSGPARQLPAGVWHQSAVADILRNTAYIGTMFYGKKMRMPGKGNPDKKTRWRVVPRAEWIAIPVPPIMPEDTFQTAQALMTRNRQQARRNRKQDYLFVSGRLRCGHCGHAMTGEVNGHSRARYKCGRKS